MANDGYLLGGKFSGTAYILGWQHDSSQQVFYSDQLINGTHDSVLNLPFTINLTNYLVSVQVNNLFSMPFAVLKVGVQGFDEFQITVL